MHSFLTKVENKLLVGENVTSLSVPSPLICIQYCMLQFATCSSVNVYNITNNVVM